MRQKRNEERVSSSFSEKWDSLASDEKTAIELTFARNRLKTKELAEFLGKGVQATRKIFTGLEEKGILSKIATSPTDPNSYYILKPPKKED